ncbi:MAG: alpha/beta fold hydrolase [Gammaproteobacteria bacterium]|nr:alpha/beta fold hydrolase [Gammaproteobacteria bacterium]
MSEAESPKENSNAVESKIAVIDDFRLQSGEILPRLEIAYETYGALAGDGRNAILITHGYMGHQHAAGLYQPGKAARGVSDTENGWWNALIGPGKPIDTRRYFVVASNTLGSSHGSTHPASIDPRTGKSYGPDFPEITMVDMVAAQRALLDRLGVQHVVAVVGWSYGGYQAFQWAVTYPTMVDGIVVTASAPKGSGSSDGVDWLIAEFVQDPNWNNGWYYDRGGVKAALMKVRIAELERWNFERRTDEALRRKLLQRVARIWAEFFDAHSLIVMRRAADGYNAEKDFAQIKAKVLYVLSATDPYFTPSLAPNVMATLTANGIDATYFQIDSDNGHFAPTVDAKRWAPVLRHFLARLDAVATGR